MHPLSFAITNPLTCKQSDAELLHRYLRERDATSFAAIVQRYGPLVLGVCRRKIPDRHLAEDAFQAVFLVLAQKAEVVRPAENLPNWLYGVSIRVAMRARAMAAKRAKREHVTAELPELVHHEHDTDDLTHLLDHAISQLPEPLKQAVILCELNGMSRKEASSRLAIAEGTLSSRLATARKKLAVILKRKDVTLPAGTLAVTATVPHTLIHAAVNTAMNPDQLTSTMQILFKAGVSMLVLQKLKYSLVAVVVIAMTTGGLSMAIAKPIGPDETLPIHISAKFEPIIKDAVWERFKSICGAGQASKKLFDEMMSDEKQSKAIREAEKSDAAAFDMYSKSAVEYEKLWNEAFSEFAGMSAGPGSSAPMQKKSMIVVPRKIVLQQLFLGSRKIPSKTNDIDKTSMHTAAFVDLMTGTEKEPARKLYLAWLEQRTNPKAYQQGLNGSLYVEIKEVLPFVRKRLAQPKEEATAIGTYPLILGNRGEKTDLKLIEKYLDDKNSYTDLSWRNSPKQQLRDLASSMYLRLSGEDPEKYGFETETWYAWWCGEEPAPFNGNTAFKSEEMRVTAFKKFNDWKEKNTKKD